MPPYVRKAPKGKAKDSQGDTQQGMDGYLWESKQNKGGGKWVWRRQPNAKIPLTDKEQIKRYRTPLSDDFKLILKANYPRKSLDENGNLIQGKYKDSCHMNKNFGCQRGYGPGSDLCEMKTTKNNRKKCVLRKNNDKERMKERMRAYHDPIRQEYIYHKGMSES